MSNQPHDSYLSIYVVCCYHLPRRLASSTCLMTSFESIAGLTDQKQKVEHYRSLLSSLVIASDVEGLKGLIDHSALPSLYYT